MKFHSTAAAEALEVVNFTLCCEWCVGEWQQAADAMACGENDMMSGVNGKWLRFADAAMLLAEAQAAQAKAKQKQTINSPTNHILSHVAAKPKESVSVAGLRQHFQTPRSLE